jgi:hypothetical protein
VLSSNTSTNTTPKNIKRKRWEKELSYTAGTMQADATTLEKNLEASLKSKHRSAI